MSERREGTSIAAGLGIGLGIAALLGLGLVLLYLLRRKDAELASGGGQVALGLDAMSPGLVHTPFSAPPRVRAHASTAARASTIRLPTGSGTPVAFGTKKTVRAQIYNVGPAGSFAVLSFAARASDGYSLPAGASQEFHLSPGQKLFARGTVSRR